MHAHARELIKIQKGEAAGDGVAGPPAPSLQKRLRVDAAYSKWKAPSNVKDEVDSYIEHAPSTGVDDLYIFWNAELPTYPLSPLIA